MLSGEGIEAQFITDATVIPATSYEHLAYHGDPHCPGSYRLPAAAKISDAGLNKGVLSATADRAVNMGFAVWLPRASSFIDADSYHQIFDPDGTEFTNPGSTQADGSKKIIWDTLDLLKGRTAGTIGPSVVVMAIPCIADNLPAKSGTADIQAYVLAPGQTPRRVQRKPQGYDRVQLAHAACQANAV